MDRAHARHYEQSYRLPFTPVAISLTVEKGGYTKTREYVYIGSKGTLVKKPVGDYPLIPRTKPTAKVVEEW
jgi:hypothetical protein